MPDKSYEKSLDIQAVLDRIAKALEKLADLKQREIERG